MDIVGIVPARGGSKGIRNKNIITFKGAPLITHTLEQASASNLDEVFVSTDDGQIAAVSKKAGATVIDRPPELASDEATTESALLHALEWIRGDGRDVDVVALLQCTSPLRRPKDINRTVSLVTDDSYDSALTCCRDHKFYWEDQGNSAQPVNYDPQERSRRQDIADRYQENGSVYVSTVDVLEKKNCRLGGRIGINEMPKALSYEIDTPEDHRIVSAIANATDEPIVLADESRDFGPCYPLEK